MAAFGMVASKMTHHCRCRQIARLVLIVKTLKFLEANLCLNTGIHVGQPVLMLTQPGRPNNANRPVEDNWPHSAFEVV